MDDPDASSRRAPGCRTVGVGALGIGEELAGPRGRAGMRVAAQYTGRPAGLLVHALDSRIDLEQPKCPGVAH